MHARTVGLLQPESQPVKDAATIEFFQPGSVQREIPLLAALGQAKWVEDADVSRWATLREAVAWCWQNQRWYIGMHERARQTMFANRAGLHAPHASRCLRFDSRAPMELPDRCFNAFEAFTGWRGIRQWQARDAGLHWVEHMMRKAA